MTYIPKTKPFPHQQRLFDETKDLKVHGLLWEMGTGKSAVTINLFSYQYEQGNIDAVLIVAPPGVHLNWFTDELPTHLPDRIMEKAKMFAWETGKSSTKWHNAAFEKLVSHRGLAILCISYPAFMTKRGKKVVWKFLKRRKVYYVLDESHNIKSVSAKRTRSIIASAKYADYKRILTGTPGAAPFDIYSQVRFLHPDLWRQHGMASYQAFKTNFGDWFLASECKALHGYDPKYDKLIRYKNLQECADILASVSDRVLKSEVLDLPDKLYSKLYFEMTPKQSAMYKELRDELELELTSGLVIDGSLAIVRLMRLQQIVCGYAVADIDEPIELCDTKNPRLDATVDYVSELPHQVIIWCRFREDINQLMKALGDSACRYDGAIDADQCAVNKNDFNAGKYKYFVANSAKGSEGLTLVGAKTAVYYSNSYKFIQRLQSEDRCHRIGQDGANHGSLGQGVLYVDVCAQGTVDDNIITALRMKYDIAAKLTGDILKEWI